MNIRFLTAGTFLIAAFCSNAYALNLGGYVFTWGSIDGQIDLKGVPNPDTKPTIVNLTFLLKEIHVLCLNPNGYNVSPGTAGSRTVQDFSEVTPAELDPDEKGKVRKFTSTKISITSDVKCNNLWEPLYESAVVKAFDVAIKLEYCGTDGDKICDYTNNEQDRKDVVVKATCALKAPLERESFYPYKGVTGQEFGCLQTDPLP